MDCLRDQSQEASPIRHLASPLVQYFFSNVSFSLGDESSVANNNTSYSNPGLARPDPPLSIDTSLWSQHKSSHSRSYCNTVKNSVRSTRGCSLQSQTTVLSRLRWGRGGACYNFYDTDSRRALSAKTPSPTPSLPNHGYNINFVLFPSLLLSVSSLDQARCY